MAKLEPLTILLVEDDLADQKLIKISLKRQKVANDLCIVSSGEEGVSEAGQKRRAFERNSSCYLDDFGCGEGYRRQL